MNIFKQITANNIIIKEYKFIKELAMEAYLIENEGILKLDDINFGDVNVLDAEIALKQGRAGKDGRIDILAKYGSEYLAIVESALNPKAVSRVGATGLWQFMYQTGKEYNLHIDSFVDACFEYSISSFTTPLRNYYRIFYLLSFVKQKCILVCLI